MPNKTTSAGKKTSTANKKPNTTSRSGTSKRVSKYRKIGRNSYIFSGIFLFLGIFLAIGYINSDGAVIKMLCDLFKGLFGFGYYFLPPALLISAWILAFSRKKTSIFRTVCIMLVPFFAGAVFQLAKGTAFPENTAMIKTLWETGVIISGGGVISGTFAYVLTFLLSSIGAWIITIILFAVDSVFALGIPLSTIFRSEAPTQKSIKEKDQFYKDFKDEIVYGTSDQEKIESIKEERQARAMSAAEKNEAIRRKIDIPLDNPDAPVKKPGMFSGFFNKRPGVKTPDEFISDQNRDVSQDEIDSAVNDENINGFPDEADVSIPSEESQESTFVGPDIISDTFKKPYKKPEPPQPVEEKIEEKAEAEEVKEEIKEEVKDDKGTSPEDIEREIEKSSQKPNELKPEYVFPPLSLLASPPQNSGGESKEEVRSNTRRLETVLKSFGINAEISNVVRGPSVTRYELELEIGIKLNKLINLSDDIALALGASGVRIAAIPNKVSTVGIEVPNKNINTVYLREIIDSPAFKNAKSKTTFAIGKDISGEAIVGNISKLPHLLIAGTTGSGKSVCLNSIILSIMYKATPDEVKFIMVDPKMVEFKVYNGIPHLLIPVVTEAKKASGALQWAVTEMMKRYRLFSETGARDLESYNKIISGTEGGEKKPQIIVVIDELADLMMIAAKEVEESVVRIAQMGRAAGVHLVIATQSPRADVITGLMKANIPSRIALKVSSNLESRIILESGGNAEKLVGNGDMLYSPTGVSRPYRIQGTWVTDEERESIVEFVKRSGTAQYSQEIINEIDLASQDKKAQQPVQAGKAEEPDVDVLFNEAVDIVIEMGQASVSMLQRRLKLGYSRAARLVDQMEEKGIVGPFEGSKPRQVLVTKEQWQEMQFVTGTAPQIPKQEVQMEPGQTMSSADDLFED